MEHCSLQTMRQWWYRRLAVFSNRSLPPSRHPIQRESKTCSSCSMWVLWSRYWIKDQNGACCLGWSGLYRAAVFKKSILDFIPFSSPASSSNLQSLKASGDVMMCLPSEYQKDQVVAWSTFSLEYKERKNMGFRQSKTWQHHNMDISFRKTRKGSGCRSHGYPGRRGGYMCVGRCTPHSLDR